VEEWSEARVTLGGGLGGISRAGGPFPSSGKYGPFSSYLQISSAINRCQFLSLKVEYISFNPAQLFLAIVAAIARDLKPQYGYTYRFR
jgi:hypothetical protein